MKHVAAELLKVAQLLIAGDVEIKGPDFRREFADAGSHGEYATFMYVKKGETTPKLRRIKPTHITSTFVKGKEEGSTIDKMFLYEGIVSEGKAHTPEVKPEEPPVIHDTMLKHIGEYEGAPLYEFTVKTSDTHKVKAELQKLIDQGAWFKGIIWEHDLDDYDWWFKFELLAKPLRFSMEHGREVVHLDDRSKHKYKEVDLTDFYPERKKNQDEREEKAKQQEIEEERLKKVEEEKRKEIMKQQRSLSLGDKIDALRKLGVEEEVNSQLQHDGFDVKLTNFMDEKKWHVLYKLVATGEGGKLYLGKASSDFQEGYSDSATWTSHSIFLNIKRCKPEDGLKQQNHRFDLDISKGRKQWDE